ncbi:MAG: hypothetical protein GF320_01335 [Armatimonadia bacterium]|nr:hypothetical protein [Armatimonadia bacterium]
MYRLMAVVFLAVLLSSVGLAQGPDAATDAVHPTGDVPVDEAADDVALEFAGGSVADFCLAWSEFAGVHVAPLRAYERELPPVSWHRKAPPPAAATSEEFDVGMPTRPLGLADPGLALSHPLGLALRPGWLLTRPDRAEAIQPRALIQSRDGEVIPFIDYRANPITLAALREQLVAYARLPILVEAGVELPGQRLPVYAEGIQVAEVIRAMADSAGLVAVPVQVGFDLEADFDRYLACMSDDEIVAQSRLLEDWADLTPDQKHALLDTLLAQYKRLGEPRRAEMRAAIAAVIEDLSQRLQVMDPDEAQALSASLESLQSDLADWYGELDPEDQGELSGLFGTMDQLFGGPAR